MFPKIDKPRHIAKLTETVAIEICGWKLDDFVLTSEIWINEYDLLCCDKEHSRVLNYNPGYDILAISDVSVRVWLYTIKVKINL